jgi:hypothetical protein
MSIDDPALRNVLRTLKLTGARNSRNNPPSRGLRLHLQRETTRRDAARPVRAAVARRNPIADPLGAHRSRDPLSHKHSDTPSTAAAGTSGSRNLPSTDPGVDENRGYTKPLVLILDDFAMRDHTAMHADDLYEFSDPLRANH